MQQLDDANAEEAEIFLDWSKIDFTAIMFMYMVGSGILSKKHLLYETVTAFCRGALGFDNVGSDITFADRYPGVVQWQETLHFNFGGSAVRLWNGRGMQGEGRHKLQSAVQYSDSRNFPGLSCRQLIRRSEAPQYVDGMVPEHILSFIRACKRKQSVALHSGVSSGFLVSRAMDATAIKRGATVSSQIMEVVGATERLPVSRVQELLSLGDAAMVDHCMKLEFHSGALEVHLQALDNTFSMPVGVFYVTGKGGQNSVKQVDDAVDEWASCCER